MSLQEDLIHSLLMLAKLAQDDGFELYIVGGVSRNLVYAAVQGGASKTYSELKNISSFLHSERLGTDIDLLINTSAMSFLASVIKKFKLLTNRSIFIIEEFKVFQTVKVKIEGLEVYDLEFASARTEKYLKPAAFPVVSLSSDIQADIPRRDFTLNSLLISLNPDNFADLIDYSSALLDMDKGLIRAFHKNSFIDDPTRIYRAFRFALEYGFEVEHDTAIWLRAALKDERFPSWFKKRQSRFLIELEKYRRLIPVNLS